MTTPDTKLQDTASVLGYTAKFVVVDGIRTRYYEVGDEKNDTMVMVHGNLFSGSSSANTWTPTFARLSEKFHVFAADKLGCGLTENPNSIEQYTQRHVVEHTYAFMKAVGIGRFHMVGQSNGAYTAARLALEHPDDCLSLVASNTGTLGPAVGDIWERREALFADPPDDPREAQRWRWELMGGRTKGDVTDEYLDASRAMANSHKARQTRSDLKKAGAEANLHRVFPSEKDETLRAIGDGQLTMPVLITWGGDDPSAILPIGLQLFELASQNSKRVRMHIFSGVGHFHYRQIPNEWSDVVANFVEHVW